MVDALSEPAAATPLVLDDAFDPEPARAPARGRPPAADPRPAEAAGSVTRALPTDVPSRSEDVSGTTSPRGALTVPDETADIGCAGPRFDAAVTESLCR